MPKGVYKHKKENTEYGVMCFQDIKKEYSNELAGYKARAAAYRENRKYNINELSKIGVAILEYVKQCANKEKPATIAGMILASNTNKDFFYKAKAGQYDYITFEYIGQNNIQLSDCITNSDGLLIYKDDENNEIVLSVISEIIEKCLLIIEDNLQQRTLTDKSMARTTGAIFNLKSVFNYNDKPESESRTVNNTLIVNASPDQTAKAMQLLLENK